MKRRGGGGKYTYVLMAPNPSSICNSFMKIFFCDVNVEFNIFEGIFDRCIHLKTFFFILKIIITVVNLKLSIWIQD